MPDVSDMELLRDYDRQGSDAAFAALVQRHINLVYSVALRHVGIAAQAEEIAQAVFVILARKAASLRPDTILEGWLHETTRLTSLSFLRGERRRQFREQEAYMQSTLQESADASIWHQLSPLLDEAMSRLGKKDRDAVIMRFFKEKNVREVAATLQVNEAAAQRRILRALEKLHRYFSKCGVSSTRAIIAGAISTNSVQAAPAALAKSVTAVAITKGAAASGSTLTLIQGALKLMAWTKAKTVIVAGIGVLLAAGTTTVTVKEIQKHETHPWQVRNVNSDVLRKVPPQVRIVPAKYPETMGAGSLSVEDGKTLGISQSAEAILETVYGQSSARTTFLDKAPSGKYDYIANLPSGNEAALQRESKRIFGLIGRRETREMDVLLLKIQSSNSPELKPADPRRLKPHQGTSSSNWGAGYYSSRNQTLSSLAWFLENRFATPVIDQTGITNHFDIDLTWDELDYQHPNLENLKQVLVDQLGLELVPTNMPIEMLVVGKAE